VPIIVLSVKDTEVDKVKSLEMGADDYIVKPFSPLELLARVKAVLRRTNMRHPEEENIPPFTAGDLAVNFSTREVLLHDHPLSLTPIEYKLLFCLVRNEGRLITHSTLQQQVWGGTDYVNPNIVKKYIHQLRTKLGDTSDPPQMILSERGQGYKFIRPRL
jgi:DNA-binding response OmpR family regulator